MILCEVKPQNLSALRVYARASEQDSFLDKSLGQFLRAAVRQGKGGVSAEDILNLQQLATYLFDANVVYGGAMDVKNCLYARYWGMKVLAHVVLLRGTDRLLKDLSYASVPKDLEKFVENLLETIQSSDGVLILDDLKRHCRQLLLEYTVNFSRLFAFLDAWLNGDVLQAWHIYKAALSDPDIRSAIEHNLSSSVRHLVLEDIQPMMVVNDVKYLRKGYLH